MRTETTITLDDRGRELTFTIKEMSAVALQKWLLKASAAFLGTGDITKLLKDVSTQGLSLLSGLDPDKAEGLLFDLLSCCYLKTGKTSVQLKPETVDGMIEDVRTLARLEAEAAKANFYFFDVGAALKSLAAFAPAKAENAIPKQSISMK